ncbi:AAA family ATPase [Actinopolymorpha pittospori]|uniref:DNA-binding CsgD family transcriptional regulator n=1 Tax=Actinopolymorpha pittospori TaxID=648752 RepID=A0A927RB47_9ACTN|nr:DNA-binding CsgD family transcriptional regulator [Actinopolymorpha pittospori]
MESSRLYGREDERHVLRAWLRRIAEGSAGSAVIEGPSGIGKSSLLEELTATAVRDGFAVVAARADRLGGAAPLALLTDAFRDSHPPLLSRADLRDLARLEDQRIGLLDRLGTALERQAIRRPVLVTLDNAELTDHATAWALAALARRLRTLPIGWLVTGEWQHVAADACPLLTDEKTPEPLVVRLGPLSDDASEELAGDLLGHAPDQRQLELVHRAGGSPFLVVEAVRSSLGMRGREPRHPKAEDTSSVATRLAAMDVPSRQLLEVGAVFGRRLTLAHVATMLDQPRDTLRPAMRELLSRGVLVEDGDQLAFAHELLWQLVYDNLPATAREVLHHDAAKVLLRDGASPLDVAGHVWAGARPGDIEAADLLRRAAREAVPRAPRVAADLYDQALSIANRPGPERTETIVEAVPVLAQVGRLDHISGLAEAAVEAGMTPEREGTIRYTLAVWEYFRRRHNASFRQAYKGLERQDLPPSARALLQAMQALILSVTGRIEESLHVAREAMAAGEGAHNLDAMSVAVWAEGVALRMVGRFTESEVCTREAVRLATEAGPAEARRLAPRRWLGQLLIVMDRVDEGMTELNAVRQDIGTFGLGWILNPCHTDTARSLLFMGQLDEARAEAEAAVSVAEELETTLLLPTARAVLAGVALLRGDLHQARGLAFAASERSENVYELELDLLRGLVADASGDSAGAIEALVPIWSAFVDHFGILAIVPTTAGDLVGVALRAGEPDYADLTTRAITRLAELNPNVPSIQAAAAHAAGLRDDDPGQLMWAAARFAADRRFLAAAHAFEDAGVRLLAHGRLADAVDHLDRALRLYADMDAGAGVERIGAQLQAVGVHPRLTRLRPPSGWAALSAPEERVARLVADGLTNRAVADELFLSPHTVDSHLRHIFTKLGVKTRVELTRVVLEQRPPEPPRRSA